MTAKIAAGVCVGILAAVVIYQIAMAATFQWRCESRGYYYGVVAGKEICVP